MPIIQLPQWLQRLRQAEIVERVRNDPRSTGDSLLGYDMSTAFNEAIAGGQADFDAPWETLTPDDRVILYAYLNQKGHLEELIASFRLLFPEDAGKPDNPIVVDIGCGPFTGGLALLEVLRKPFDYIGIDRAQAMLRLGERLARSTDKHGGIPSIECRWASSIDAVEWDPAKSWRDVIIIMSYLLASPTLDAQELAHELNGLLEILGRGRATLLYTNSARSGANQQFAALQASLGERGFELNVDGTATIDVARGGTSQPRGFRYALFHRAKRTVLELGDP